MDGYGPYVWSCFALTVIVLIYNVWAARRGLAEQVLKAKRRIQIAESAQP